MAISEDTAAIVAAQLTSAWAVRMGPATDEQRGKIGPTLVATYRTFLGKISEGTEGGYDMEGWL